MTVDTRQYTTRRQNIVNALVELIERIDGTGEQQTAVAECSPRLTFWDEVKEFPAVHINAGREVRSYDGGGFKFRYLTLTLRCYVEDNEDAVGALDALIEDLETTLEHYDPITYYDKNGVVQKTVQTTILSIDTDEGVLDPLGVGEIQIEVQY
jgi:hypothetical protein